MSYGVKLISASGNAFILPDNNPFTFAEKFSVHVGSNTSGTFYTKIPIDRKLLLFCHGYSSSSGFASGFGYETLKGNQHYYIKWFSNMTHGDSVTFTVYAFSDMSIEDPNGGDWGLKILDEKGVQVYGTDSKPLKLEVLGGPPAVSPPTQAIAGLPGKYAIMGTPVGMHTDGTVKSTACYFPVGLTRSNGANQVFAGFINYGFDMGPRGTTQWFYGGQSIVLGIDIDSY